MKLMKEAVAESYGAPGLREYLGILVGGAGVRKHYAPMPSYVL
ncbi:MAG: hypothetical protein QXL79_02005 [Sulfolobales archaeon]